MYIIYYIDWMNGYQYHGYCINEKPSEHFGPVMPSESEWIVPGTIED